MAVGGILARNTDTTVTQTGPGTAGQVLTSNGAGAVPTFQTLAVTADYVVMSNGANPPTPVDDGAGNFMYVGYTP
jgi:hypothetical protein